MPSKGNIINAAIRTVQGNPGFCMRFRRAMGHMTEPIDAPEATIPKARPRYLSKYSGILTKGVKNTNAFPIPSSNPWVKNT